MTRIQEILAQLAAIEADKARKANEELAKAVRLAAMRQEIERLKLANALGVKSVTDAEVCKAKTLERHARYVLVKE